MIDSYTFGEIIIAGQKYTKDVIIGVDAVHPDWWRESGHVLSINDLNVVLVEKPEVLIIGTGAMGVMHVPHHCLNELKKKGIEAHIHKTEKACELYNALHKKRKVVAALHLTC